MHEPRSCGNFFNITVKEMVCTHRCQSLHHSANSMAEELARMPAVGVMDVVATALVCVIPMMVCLDFGRPLCQVLFDEIVRALFSPFFFVFRH